MRATATPEQIRKFSLLPGDVIITKDSETPDDIGVPALVKDEIPDLVCGYHLAVMRPKAGVLYGPYLLRLLQSAGARAYYSLSANGVTRFGLTQYGVKNLPVEIPSFAEQRKIADFLDRETAKADALVSKYERLIDLLEEKRVALITRAVTRGLNPNEPMKDSGVPSIGTIPANWQVKRVKHAFTFLDGRRIPLSSEERASRQGDYPYYGASGVIDHVNDYLFDDDLVLVSEDGANLLNRARPIAFIATGKYWVNNHAHILKPHDDALAFWAERLEAEELAPYVTGSAQPKLTIEALANIVISAPIDIDERRHIAAYVHGVNEQSKAAMMAVHRAIALLQEHKGSLITAAVTGQFDVRNYRAKDVKEIVA